MVIGMDAVRLGIFSEKNLSPDTEVKPSIPKVRY